jgi:hypothetical protein
MIFLIEALNLDLVIHDAISKGIKIKYSEGLIKENIVIAGEEERACLML